MLFSVNAWASGKIQLQANVLDDETVRPQFGLAVYQHLMKRAALNSWAGYGVRYLEDSPDVNWLVLKNELQVNVKNNWTVSPGLELQWDVTNSDYRNKFYVRADYKIW